MQTVPRINDSTGKEIYSDVTASRFVLYNLYACPLVFVTEENSKNRQSLILQVHKQFCNSKLRRATEDVLQHLADGFGFGMVNLQLF